MQEQGDPVWPQVVAGHRRDVVDAHSAVHVADPVLDGAGVGVRHRRAVAKVHRYASGGARPLQTTRHSKQHVEMCKVTTASKLALLEIICFHLSLTKMKIQWNPYEMYSEMMHSLIVQNDATQKLNLDTHYFAEMERVINHLAKKSN